MESLSAWPSRTQWMVSRNDLLPRYSPMLTRHLWISSKQVGGVEEEWWDGIEGGRSLVVKQSRDEIWRWNRVLKEWHQDQPRF